MRQLMILCALGLLASCNGRVIKGKLSADSDLTFKVKKAFSSKMKDLKVPAGNHSGKITLSSKKKLKLKLEGMKKVEFKIPEGASLPVRNGNLFISAADSGQDYDLNGVVETNTTYSGTSHGTRSCTYYVRERVCRRVCHTIENKGDRDRRDRAGRDGRGNRGDRGDRGSRRVCERKCRIERVGYPGHQDYEYYYSYTNKYLTVNLSAANSNLVKAKFSGSWSDTDRHETSTSSCR